MAQNSGKFALDNLTYDLIAILHEKSQGLEAFERYMKDVQGDSELKQIFERMKQNDIECIQQIQDHLQRRLGQSSGQQNKAA